MRAGHGLHAYLVTKLGRRRKLVEAGREFHSAVAELGVVLDDVAEAVAASGAPILDVSSGVERGPGLKDPALIQAFLDAVRRVQ